MYSLTRRLLTWVSVALALFLGLSALALDAIFRDLAERSVRELLDAQMVALVAAVETDEDGRIRGASTQAESRLQTPGSGLYAEIRVRGGAQLWRSPSAAGTFIDFGPDVAPGSSSMSFATLPHGERLALARRGIQWEVGTAAPQQLTFAVATSMQPYAQQLRRFRTQLGGGLVALSALLLLTLAMLPVDLLIPLLDDPLYQEIAANALEQKAFEFDSEEARDVLEQFESDTLRTGPGAPEDRHARLVAERRQEPCESRRPQYGGPRRARLCATGRWWRQLRATHHLRRYPSPRLSPWADLC